LAAALWIGVSGWRRRSPAFWAAVLVLLGWLLFVRTFWGAGAQPGSLGYLEARLSTLRYVEGFLALGEVLLIWFLWKRGVPVPFLMALVGVQGASRLWLLYAQPNLRLFPVAWWMAAALVAGLLCVGMRALAAGALAVGLAAAAPAIVERNRAEWLPSWKEVYEPLRNVPGSSVFLLDDSRSGSDAAQFALSGARLEHDVRLGRDLNSVNARYAVRMLDRAQPRSELAAFAAGLAPRGYRTMVEGAQGIVLERVAAAGWDASAGPTWYLPPGTLPAAGIEIDAGDTIESRHRMQAGELAFSPPDRVLRVGSDATTAPAPTEESVIEVRNCGRPPGLTYRFRGGRWLADRPSLAVPASPVVSIERGKFEIEHLQDAEGPFLRVRALNDAAWLVLVTEFPRMAERAPYTALSAARCAPGATCTFWLWTKAEVSDYAGPARGQWETFRQLRRVRDFAAGDHLAIGIKRVRGGDVFDVREIGVLAGYFP
jgi:hypothetical protein